MSAACSSSTYNDEEMKRTHSLCLQSTRTKEAFMVWIKFQKKSYPNTFAMEPVSADVALDHEVPFFIHLQLNICWRRQSDISWNK